MASSGPTSATERNGERCQSTTSISAAEAISENGTIVQRTFERVNANSDRCELTATTAVIRIRFTPYCAEAAAPTRASTPLAPTPSSGDDTAPAAVAASASTETLYATRTGGRCSSNWVMAGARKTTSRPAAQPKRTIEATPKTNDSETPPVSTPSTGTGNRSASVEARSSAARPSSVVVLCGVTAKDTTAAQVTPRPAAQTGRRTARSRGGGKTRRVMSRLPVQVVGLYDLDAEAAERDEHERQNDSDCDESRLPVQHLKPPPGRIAGRRRFSRLSARATSPGRGKRCGRYLTPCRPASASGRRAQANCWRYQPVSGVTATPCPDEWIIQPPPT